MPCPSPPQVATGWSRRPYGVCLVGSSDNLFDRQTESPVPADRVAALRTAFEATLKDPEFLKGAEQRKIPIEFRDGKSLGEVAAKVVSSSPRSASRRSASPIRYRRDFRSRRFDAPRAGLAKALSIGTDRASSSTARKRSGAQSVATRASAAARMECQSSGEA